MLCLGYCSVCFYETSMDQNLMNRGLEFEIHYSDFEYFSFPFFSSGPIPYISQADLVAILFSFLIVIKDYLNFMS